MGNKEVPVLFSKDEDCCGCGACYSICPRNAIKMVISESGFKYPVITNEICIRCSLCLKVCPVKECH